MEVPVEDVGDHEDRGQKVEKLDTFLHETGAVAHVDKADNHNKIKSKSDTSTSMSHVLYLISMLSTVVQIVQYLVKKLPITKVILPAEHHG